MRITYIVSVVSAFLGLFFWGGAAEAETFTAGERVDAGAHPRTIFLAEELDEVRDRVQVAPYSGFLAQVVRLAGQSWALDDHSVDVERSKADTARAAAYLFILDRTVSAGEVRPFASAQARLAMGEKAVTLLMSMKTESRASGFDATEDIHTAQELHLWAETLDLLLGSDLDVLQSRRAEAVQKVADLAAGLYGHYCVTNWIFLRSEVSNHRSKSAAAVGLAAIVLNGEDFEKEVEDGSYDLNGWVDFAIRNLDLVLRDLLSDGDGGYAEGGTYLAYSGVDHYPFMWAWHKYTGAADFELSWAEPVAPYYVLGASGAYTVPDLWTSAWMQRQLDWTVRTMMPDGSLPPFDDSTPGAKLYWGIFVRPELPEAGLYRWAWERAGRPAGGSPSIYPMLISTFDDSIEARSPESTFASPTQLMPAAGQAIFRGGWGTDDVWFSLLAEHGNAASLGHSRWGNTIDGAAAHEHPDAGSVAMAVGSQTLLLDPGYLGWANHHKVNGAEDHSAYLVDGKGPARSKVKIPPFDIGDDGFELLEPEVEGGYTPAEDGLGYILSAGQGARFAFAQSHTSVFVDAPEAEILRRVTFLDGRFAVLHDRVNVKALQEQERTVTHLLHPNCGGSSGGSYEEGEDGVATCTRAGVRLRMAVGAQGPSTRTTREAIHDAGGWLEATHTAVETHTVVEGPGGVDYLTVLLPERAVDGSFEDFGIDWGQCAGPCASWGDDQLRCEAWSGEVRQVMASPSQRVTGARAGAWCRGGAEVFGVLFDVDEQEGTTLSFEGRLEAEQLRSWRAELHSQDHRVDSVRLELPAVDGARPDGACGVEDVEGGRWSMTVAARGAVETRDVARSAVARIRLVDQPFDQPAVVPVNEDVVLDGSHSCGAVVEGARFTLIEAPEMSRLTFVDFEAPEMKIRMSADLPGRYEVRLDVEGGQGTESASLRFEVEGEPSGMEPSVEAWSSPEAQEPDAGAPEPDGGDPPEPEGGVVDDDVDADAEATASAPSGCAVTGGGPNPAWPACLTLILLCAGCIERSRARGE